MAKPVEMVIGNYGLRLTQGKVTIRLTMAQTNDLEAVLRIHRTIEEQIQIERKKP